MSTTNSLAEQTADVVTPDSTPGTTEVTDVQVPEVDDVDAAEPESTETVGAEPTGAEKRIKQLSAQRKAEQEARIRAEIEREYYKGLAEGSKSKPVESASAQPTNTQLVPPDINSYDTYDDYENARLAYNTAITEQRIFQKIHEQQRAAAAQQSAQATVSKFEKAAAEDSAFAEIWKNKPLWDTLPINQPMAEIIAASDVSPEVIKWVHNNRSEAQRIASMPPILAAREIALVEARIKLAPKPEPPKRVSAAPEPVKPLAGSSPATIDEDDLPMEEYYKRRTKQMYGR